SVYFTVCPRQDVDPIDEFLYPMFPEDVEEKKYDMRKLARDILAGTEISLCTIFMKCDLLKLRALMKSKKRYRGTIITDKSQYTIEVRLEQSKRYHDEIEGLYHVFQRNGVPWKTVNNPYANRFFDVILTECKEKLDPEEEIREINLMVDDYEAYTMKDMVLLWNIERLFLKSVGFPTPALDRINFEHEIPIRKTGIEHGYLVNDAEERFQYIRRNAEEIIVVSSEEKAGLWSVLKITQPPEDFKKDYGMTLVMNRKRHNSINRFAAEHGMFIRTKGEIERLLNAHAVSDQFRLESIEIMSPGISNALTYDMNWFVVDDIRVGNDKKIMKLRFSTKNRDFILYDLLSFLVSEVQMRFPEYQCEGELV
ncbi:MAG TPA: normocyte-binding protein, partial [Bacillota bacterium]|nr:normocyte-binding protein [Bacillota bacterium]